jgi:uncharacterized membrane protein YdjX (TVP38/TMEM64 family)
MALLRDKYAIGLAGIGSVILFVILRVYLRPSMLLLLTLWNRRTLQLEHKDVCLQYFILQIFLPTLSSEYEGTAATIRRR